MKANKRITHAYCVEASAVLPITGARQFYFSNPKRGALHFLCSTEICRKGGVKVTGANYHIPPQEESNHPIAHYKANPVDEHDLNCEWVGPEQALAQRPDESSEQFVERKAKRKLKDYVDCFDPTGTDDEDEVGSEGDWVTSGESARGGAPRKGGGSSEARHATNSLERLVQCYREAKDSLSKEEFEGLTLNVKGPERRRRRLSTALAPHDWDGSALSLMGCT